MPVGRVNARFVATTRGRIVGLLRRVSRTADDLASELGLTGNVVRAHLTALERDGLIRQQGLRRNQQARSCLRDHARRRDAFLEGLSTTAHKAPPNPG